MHRHRATYHTLRASLCAEDDRLESPRRKEPINRAMGTLVLLAVCYNIYHIFRYFIVQTALTRV